MIKITDDYWTLHNQQEETELSRMEVGTVVINVADMLKAIKEHCPKEWAEAISDDLDDAWRDGQ